VNSADWLFLWAISASDGTVGVDWGMDTLSRSVNASAQYLKIYATGGDNSYSVGELQAFGTGSAIPEPSSMLLLGLGGLAAGLFKKRKSV
ncbi:MAG: PEP-CTERM sorting domain-containing protein, partial [Candidatus Omnitrophota bacterium]|nr:PEP-CTERM sorting domain-containing protein [Candidatus Omnitrophota bacterium]